jgi:hypothetical protein
LFSKSLRVLSNSNRAWLPFSSMHTTGSIYRSTW